MILIIIISKVGAFGGRRLHRLPGSRLRQELALAGRSAQREREREGEREKTEMAAALLQLPQPELKVL